MPDRYERLAFFLATDALKETRRANWIYTSARCETVAEHDWHALLLAMLLADAAPEGVDHNRVRDLLIVHDLVELYAGDTPIWDDVAREGEAEREMAAGERLIALLPDDVFPRFDLLRREYHALETEAARFARVIDALHPVLMAWTEGAHGHVNTGIMPTRLLERKRSTIEPYPVLWNLVIRIVQHAVDRGMMPPDDLVQRSGDLSDTTGGIGLTTPNGPEPPVGRLDLFSRLAFFLATDRLKEETRANLILSQPRHETVAEHCWHVLLLGMLLSDCAPAGINGDRVADLLIVHDLTEVYAGDTSIDDLAGQETAAGREAQAAEQLL